MLIEAFRTSLPGIASAARTAWSHKPVRDHCTAKGRMCTTRGSGFLLVTATFKPRHTRAVDLPARLCTTATIRFAESFSNGTCHSRGANGRTTDWRLPLIRPRPQPNPSPPLPHRTRCSNTHHSITSRSSRPHLAHRNVGISASHSWRIYDGMCWHCVYTGPYGCLYILTGFCAGGVGKGGAHHGQGFSLGPVPPGTPPGVHPGTWNASAWRIRCSVRNRCGTGGSRYGEGRRQLPCSEHASEGNTREWSLSRVPIRMISVT